MESKIPDLTGHVDQPRTGSAGDTARTIDRMFGVVDDARSNPSVCAPRLPSSRAPRPTPVLGRAGVPVSRGSATPPRYPSVLIDRLFAAAQKAWRRVWNPKLAGERIEMLFMYEAARRGLIVSKPFGDSAPYDAIVEDPKHPGKLWRVQVQSTSFLKGGCYVVQTRHSCNTRVLTPRDADILAAYIVPRETWYIIPVSVIGKSPSLYLSPHQPRKRRSRNQELEQFREAWRLIGADAKPAR